MKKQDIANNMKKAYEKYRWFYTNNNTLVVGGKSDSQNEIVLKEFSRPNYTVLHTKEPGSPFAIIIKDKPGNEDINEAAVFCACFSKQWKSDKKKVLIDIFRGSDIYKTSSMKTGTFGVKGKRKTIEANLELAIVIQKGKVRAVPTNTREKKLALIQQGKLSKEDAARKIIDAIKKDYHLPITLDEVMAAIPSDKISVKEIKQS